jgi:hypothetical protein
MAFSLGGQEIQFFETIFANKELSTPVMIGRLSQYYEAFSQEMMKGVPAYFLSWRRRLPSPVDVLQLSAMTQATCGQKLC